MQKTDQILDTNAIVYSGVPWYDQNGETVNAHAGCVVHFDGKYFLFGEYKTDTSNEFSGFSCYSSTDLCNWHFEGLALPPQESGLMGPQRVGERVKVAHCPATGKFVMFAHSDDMGYRDPVTVVALAENIAGPYKLVGPLEYQGQPLRRWDLGLFQDYDGSAYVLYHEGEIFRLSPDFCCADTQVVSNCAPGGESPAIVRHEDQYFWMFSNKTSWDRNDNYYLTSTSLSGPWENKGLFAPVGTQTWDSQCGHIFDVQMDNGNVTSIYMGDRWSYPEQKSSATYVWMPLQFDRDTLCLPDFWDAWDPATASSVQAEGTFKSVHFDSEEPGNTFTWDFCIGEADLANRLAIRQFPGPDGGYAEVTIRGSKGSFSQVIDCYSKDLREKFAFVSNVLSPGSYSASIKVLGRQSEFWKKDGTRLGSNGFRVNIQSVGVIQ